MTNIDMLEGCDITFFLNFSFIYYLDLHDGNIDPLSYRVDDTYAESFSLVVEKIITRSDLADYSDHSNLRTYHDCF